MHFPHDYKVMFRACFGDDAWLAYKRACEGPATRGVRLNPLKKFHGPALSFGSPVPWADGAFYISPDDAPGKDPLHAGGYFYLQEPSAMAPVAVLAPRPGEHVLDLCAAPGGKTTQIGALLHHKGTLVANEPYPDRCKILAENVERLGLRNVLVTQLEPSELARTFPGRFDAILVDAPCSGEGMFRKDPDAISYWHRHLPVQNARRQLDILESAYTMLSTTGRLVYSTCTFNPVENEAVCAAFLFAHNDLELLPIALPGSLPALTSIELVRLKRTYLPLAEILPDSFTGKYHTERALRFFPHTAPGEGHFVACFVRRISAQDHGPASERATQQQPVLHSADAPFPNKRNGPRVKRTGNIRLSTASDQLLKEFHSFAQNSLQPGFIEHLLRDYQILSEGSILYAVKHLVRPERGVLRPGLPLFYAVHKHYQPSHALALTLQDADVRREYRLPYGAIGILRYLQGASLPVDSHENGWTLVTVAGIPLGWAKQVGGLLKNHYPKGLRREYIFAQNPLDS